MKKESQKGLRIRSLVVKNYKVLDELELDFPEPRMPDDPDMVVIGSENGVGKTSVLECCALMIMAACETIKPVGDFERYGIEVDPYDLMIRSGCSESSIRAELRAGKLQCEPTLSIMRRGQSKVAGEIKQLRDYLRRGFPRVGVTFAAGMRSLLGFSTDPLVLPGLVYFHSYRKVQEGSPELGSILEDGRPHRAYLRRPPRYRAETIISAFKLEIIRLMMSKANLFEELDDRQAGDEHKMLNDLLEEYAGVSLLKLKPLPDNAVELRLQPKGAGSSYSFDGLSSGQKEIMSTLFLIWRHARQMPGVVLIDEPELHLNAEWHRTFMRRLLEIAPNSQFIVATHSRDVFEYASPDRRVLLELSKGVLVS